MKNIFIKMIILSSAVLIIGVPVSSTTVNASAIKSNLNQTSSNQQKYLSLSAQKEIDAYVTVKDNQYVLSDKVKTIVSKDEYLNAQSLIMQANDVISKNDLVINRQTKVATNTFTLTSDENSMSDLARNIKSLKAVHKKKYHYGVNKISVHWNYTRVYMNKTLAQNVASGVVGGLSGLIGAVASGPAVATIVGAIGSVVSSQVGSIKGGIWVDYNYFHGFVKTKWGWQ